MEENKSVLTPFSEEEKKMIEEASGKVKQSQSKFVALAGLERAKKVLGKNE